MSHGKQFTLFTQNASANGWKSAFVLHELDLSYSPIYLDLAKDVKQPWYTQKYNPNGRTPCIVDHWNNDFILWESNAIYLYLVERYDKEHKISAEGEEERYLQYQWLFFQASGQGPYYGQAVWFTIFHHEDVPSARERYRNEVLRVLGVLESVLSTREWLVGNKCTIADISFVPWNIIATTVIFPPSEFSLEERFPAVYRWHTAVMDRPAIKEVARIQTALKEKQDAEKQEAAGKV